MGKPYKLFGKSELESLEKVISAKISAWLGEWSTNESELSNIEIEVEKQMISTDSKLYGANYECADSVLSIAIDETLYSQFPEILLPVGSNTKSRHSVLVKNILNKAFFDLVKSFLVCVTDKKTNLIDLDKDTQAELTVKKASGDVYIQINLKYGCIFMRLPYCVVDSINSFEPVNNVITGGLRKRDDCVISGELKLNVNVGGAEVDFGSVVAMQPGDVIRLDSKITDLMTVSTENGEFVCKASLGKQGQSKAIKVII